MALAEVMAATTTTTTTVATIRVLAATINAAKDPQTGRQADQTDPRHALTPTIQTFAGTTTIIRKMPLIANLHAPFHQATTSDRETAEGGAGNLLGSSPW